MQNEIKTKWATIQELKRTCPVVAAVIKTIILFNFFLLTQNGYSQMGEWTWMNGDSIPNSMGHFGTQGVFDPLNSPPALYEATQWTDFQGNFWLFGGLNDTIHYADLWEFNPIINQWAWIKGNGLNNQLAIYGVKGNPSPTNSPGSIGYGVESWVDTSGNLWLFGGGGNISNSYGMSSTLWKYTIQTNEWTWMAGPDTLNDHGTFGTIMVPNSMNNPPARSESTTSWIDSNNCLWLFGGFNNQGYLSDLWKFNISTNQWTWVNGSNISDQPTIYGTMGVSNPTNMPGARWSYTHWKDGDGNFCMFGGYGYINSNGFLNDIWKYNPVINEWTWIGGTNIGNDTGSLGNYCDTSINSMPRATCENTACWSRDCNNIIFFGGQGSHGYNNDLWNYDANSNIWTWINGSIYFNQIGNFGNILISSPSNIPSSRCGSVSWTDNSGNLWLFGGISKAYTNFQICNNNLWRFVPDTSCPHIYCIGVGINESKTNKVEIDIYPNPNEGIFKVSYKLSSLKIDLQIVDILGRIIYTYSIMGDIGVETIDVSKLSKGFYFIQIVNEKETLIKKLIIR